MAKNPAKSATKVKEKNKSGDFSLQMEEVLASQKAAYIRDGVDSAEIRIDRLNRAIALLKDNAEALADALSADFGQRGRQMSLITDVIASIGPLEHAKAHVRKWMKPKSRPTSPRILGLFGAKAKVTFQPKGTIGIISPWNFPVNLTFGPLAQILAAGNRAMIKPSEATPNTSALMEQLINHAFSPEEVMVFTGDADVGEAFSKLAFDHLIFTGSTQIGAKIMKAAAKNLVPVTLELGGKCPVILGKSAPIETSCARIMAGKLLNSGQVCLAPDYILVHASKLSETVEGLKSAARALFPDASNVDDYTAIVSDRHHGRLMGLLNDAAKQGAQIIEVETGISEALEQNLTQNRLFPPHLVLGATDGMDIMRDEIFGPLLPIITYETTEEAIAYVNGHPRPLALYYFGLDDQEQEKILNHTVSGGVTINDVVFHIAMENLPFGGVGPSGMGAYHGYDGFLAFSHQRAIYSQLVSDIGPLKALRPPFGTATDDYIKKGLK